MLYIVKTFKVVKVVETAKIAQIVKILKKVNVLSRVKTLDAVTCDEDVVELCHLQCLVEVGEATVETQHLVGDGRLEMVIG